MLKALLRVRIAALLAWFTGAGSTKKKKKSKARSIGFALLMVYVLAAFLFMFGALFSAIAEPFYMGGISWLYFTFFGITVFAIMFVGSIFMAKAQLFEARDNELLLSMPVKPSQILLSRIVALLIINLVFNLAVSVPAGVVWCMAAPVTAGGVIAYILINIGLILLSTALACLFAWLISMMTSRIRNKSLFTVLFSLILLGAYFYFYSQLNTYINELIQNAQVIAGEWKNVNLVYCFGNSVAAPDFGQLAAIVAVCVVTFVIAYIILSKTFIKVVTTKRGFAKIKYEEKSLTVSSAYNALVKREFSRLLATPSYLLNAGLGVVFFVIGGVAVLLFGDQIQPYLTMFSEVQEFVPTCMIFLICMMGGMILFTAPTISLEGKTLWLLQSLPVSTKQILDAKLAMSNKIALPSVVFFGVAASYAFKFDMEFTVIMMVTIVAFTMLAANIGLIFDLKHPNLKWINDTQAVKQSASVILSMLVVWALVLIPGALYVVLLSEYGMIVSIAYLVVILALWRLSYVMIMKKGIERFENI